MWQIVAVTWSEENDIGVQLADYQTVTHEDLAAIITPATHQAIEGLNPYETIDELFLYQSTLERAGIDRTIIPLRFGTIIRKKKEVIALLEQNARKFRTLLRFSQDKAEFDLMGIWKERIGNFDGNIFEDLERSGYELKVHSPGNKAICFHVSILMTPDERETFTVVKENLHKRLGDEIDLRLSEPLPPYSFFTLDISESMSDVLRKPQLVMPSK
jgi:hypothetical protein